MITVAALCVLAVTAGAVWTVSAQKADQEMAEQQATAEPAPPSTPVDPDSGARAPAIASQESQGDTDAATPTSPDEQTKVRTSRAAKPADRTTPVDEPTATEATPRTQQQRDYDGDGIPDARDRCPRRSERYNNHKDGDGCPDVVTTTGAS